MSSFSANVFSDNIRSKKIQAQNVVIEKLQKNNFFQKAACKNVDDIDTFGQFCQNFEAAFAPISFLPKNTKPSCNKRKAAKTISS